MIYNHILIRYGEISTKGQNRKKFVEQLKRNIAQALEAFSNAKIKFTRDRMYVHLNGENHEPIVEELQKVFGIQSFSLALKAENDIEQIKEFALQAAQEFDQPNTTFKVSARRADKQFPLDTHELNYEIGSHILRNTENLKVDVRNPDVNVRVEVRKEATYITCFDYPGAGGLPVGASGKAMLMLSGGIDSPVAGFLAMKRGLEIEAVHFYSPPFTSERSKQKVIDLAQKLTAYSGKVRLHVVPFTAVQQAIQKQIPENYTMTSTRRMMLKITDRIREKQDSLAIVTGESLGQVASQTIESMFAINEVTNTPIIRPLITMDKTDIIKIARKIDTHEISNRPYEDCCTIFTPSSPKTKPKREKVNRYEQFFDFDPLIEEAVQNTEVMELTSELNNQSLVAEEDLF
ncbi:tRNA uracil 4-sulfurtransferase ThiI [Metabacillus iocasae]|uniref:Probable tRNA sulfurtransferase n=1 Tax=Priestia iocasae TaxID=2291674 RepID=A0ABS2QP21_9BACI|nr:tRNA uracil 4-sulfurtransferase ThiI [Metabacillus iocasae]MBM7701201.1 thiamine biosynthesis protein ThiI [Metabacillus iocasae]